MEVTVSSESVLSVFRGKFPKVDDNVIVSDDYITEDYDISFVAMVILLSLKHYSKEISVPEINHIVGNVFFLKYKLNRILHESIANSPALYEKISEALVFLEMGGMVDVDDQNNRKIMMTDRGVSCLKLFEKDRQRLNREFRVVLTRIKKEGFFLI